MLCFDIGAYIGKWTIANKDRYDKIVTIEASPKTYDVCKANLAFMTDKCECINYAVCNNNNEDVQFHVVNNHDGSLSTLSSLNPEWFSEISRFSFEKDITTIKCKSITLDKLIELYGVPDLIKIDAEGSENSVVASLTKMTPLICFEWASEMNHIAYECLEHLHNLGYEKFYLQYEDDYNFRPDTRLYTSREAVKNELLQTIPKHHWGMIWTCA